MIGADETRITAEWTLVDGHARSNGNDQRIYALIATHLRKLATDWRGWESLYEDPTDGRYWELTFPHGEMHGGGPPELRYIDKVIAAEKYSPTPKP
jgi:hypothetical protein